MTWIEEARQMPFGGIAAALGITIEGDRGGPCPNCRETRRSSSDPRPTFDIFVGEDERVRWKCWAGGGCGAGGDQIDLVAWKLLGKQLKSIQKENYNKVSAWFDEHRQEIQELDASTNVLHRRQSPPLEGLLEFGTGVILVASDPEVSCYLRARRLDPATVDANRIAVALPKIITPQVTPPWAHVGSRSWIDSGHRLIVPMLNARGRVVSTCARCVNEGSTLPKVALPKGYTADGLVMVNTFAVALLRGDPMPANVGVVVVEGMTDFIAAATNPGWSVFPVIGITSGSWNCEIAARIPNGAMVLVWTDADDVGDEYAERIDATLKRRCSVLRGRPDQIAEGANDLCDLVHLGKLPERPNTDVTQISKVEDWVSELVSSKVKHGPLLSIDHWSVLSGSDWLDTKPPPQRFLLCDENGHGVLARGKAGLLAGAGAVGKTTLLADLGLAAATGKNWLGELGYSVEEPGAVAMVLAEDDDKDVRRRIYNLSRRKELDAGQLDLVRKRLFIQAAAGKMVALTEAGPERGAEDVTTEYSKWLFNQLKTCAPSDGWALIVLDPLSRFAGPDVEADNSAATRLVQVIETFLTLPGNPTVLVSHHTTKESRQRGHGEAVGVRGSSALTDGFRWVGTMTYDGKPKDGEKERLIAFRIPKSNYAAWSAPKYLVRVADGGGMLRVASAEEIADHKKKQGDDNHDDGDATQGGWGQGG